MKAKVEVENIAPESAYLGPKLWEKPISFNEDDYFVMNIEDFLAENELSKDKFGGALKTQEGSPPPEDMKCTSFEKLSYRSPESPYESEMSPISMEMSSSSSGGVPSPSSPGATASPRPGVIVSSKECKRNSLPKGENSFLYAESKRAKLEREREEKKRKLEVEFEFAPEDLALATVPGVDFDPRERAFAAEELKPQPIIRKRPKLFVPEDNKDDKYWDRRSKNNFAARRSREARRLKENQIALRAAYLEKENNVLKRELDDANFKNSKLALERDILKKKLAVYEGGRV